jgi:flagellar M-ring protein FliF
MDARATSRAEDGAAAAVPQDGPGGLLALLRTLGPGRIAALGAVALVLLSFFAFVAWRVSAPEYTILFAGLQLADAERLTQRLDALGVPYRLSGGGDAVMVPADRALKLRMSLAEEGQPVGSTVGYELLDKAGPFGTSEFQANINLRRAIEGELARSIGTLRQVRSARVHINLPKRELFARDAAPPTASIVLAFRGGATLEKSQIAGIKHLVAAAVPALAPERVTLVDDSGNLLAQAADPGSEGLAGTEAEDYRAALEARLKAKIVQLLERTLGPGHVEAEVSADIDFDEVATTAESYDPNGQVVRSTQTTSDKTDSDQRQQADNVTVANNLPTERAQGAAAANGSSERANRTEETVNYEISRVVRNQTHKGGTVRRLSVAVQVDGTYRTQPDGTVAYEPRSADELKELAALVRGAAGIAEDRGDRLEVVARRFVKPADQGAEPAPFLGLEREDYWRAGELATYGLLTLVVLFFGVRPVVRRVLPTPPATLPLLEAGTLLGPDGTPLPSGSAPALLPAPGGGEQAAITAEDDGTGSGAAPVMLDLKNVRGQVRASLVDDVSSVVADRPEEAVRVIRGWLHAR